MSRHQLFGPEWAAAYVEALNRNEDYARAAAKWEGPLGLALRGSEGIEPRAVVLDLAHGECREGHSATVEEAIAATDFLLEAHVTTWRQVLAGTIEPIFAIMRGKLALKKGSLAKLLPYTRAAAELVRSAHDVPTRWPDEGA